MRVAYFTNTYPRATDTFIRREVVGLREKGIKIFTYSVRKVDHSHDVDDITIAEKESTQYLLPASVFSLLKNFISILAFRPLRTIRTIVLASQTSKPGVRGALLQIAYFFEAVQLSDRILKDKIEHIHNHFGDNSGTVTMLASLITDIPYSISIHGPHIFFDELNWALDEKTHYAKFVTCIGSYCKSKMMMNTARENWEKFHIVRCGIDLTQFHYRKPNNAIKRMMFLGRLSPEKGITFLLDSILELKRNQRTVELVIMGDGEDRPELEEYVKKNRLEDTVNFIGFVGQREIISQLNQGDILVLPSFAEGIPVVLMEAMAIGVPVIATHVGGVTELVVHNETGQVVSPANSTSLTEAITRYLDNPELCEKVSFGGRKMVEQEFNIVDQIDRLELLLTRKD